MVFVPNNNDGDTLRTESSNSFRYFTEDDIKNGVAACDVHSLLSAYSTASEFETEFIPLPQSNLSMSQQKDRISEAQVNAWKSVVKELAKRFTSPKKWKSSGDLMSPSPSPDIFQWVTDQGSYFIEVPSVVSDPLESYQYATIRRRNGRSVLIANRELLRREAPTWTTFKGNAEGALEGNYYGLDRSERARSEGLNIGDRIKRESRSDVGRIEYQNRMSKHSMTDHLDEHQAQIPIHDDTLSTRSRSPGEAPSYRHDSSHIQPTEEELGPLPPNWEKAYTERGEVYFIDHNSGTSQWLDPRLARLQKKSLEECSDDELPYGWEKIDDPHYGVYYIDHVNRKTQYENPVLQAKRLAMNNNGGGSISDSGSNTFPRPRKSPSEPPIGLSEPLQEPVQPKRVPSDSTLKRSKKTRDYPRNFFTRNPAELQGEKIVTRLIKSTRGLGFTIVGGDDADDEFLQIKSVVPNGPAWLDGKLRTGDVIVYVNDVCVLGFTHHDMVSMFQRIAPGEAVMLEVCRGYPLSFDLNDPNTEIVTTVAVSADPYVEEQGQIQSRPGSTMREEPSMGWSENGRVSRSVPEAMGKQDSRPRASSRPGSADILQQEPEQDLNLSAGSLQPIEYLTVRINKGDLGFGFTIADSANGQKVKKILDRPRCKNLQEGDILVDINGIDMRPLSHSEVVQLLKDCPKGQDATITVQRGGVNSPRKNKWKKSKDDSSLTKKPLFSFAGLYRSKTPTADLYSAQTKEVVPTRPKTPLVDTRQRSKTPNEYENRSSIPREFSRTPVGDIVNQFTNVHFDEDPYSRTKQRSKSPGRELEETYQNGYDEYNQRIRPPPPPKPINTRQYQPDTAYYQQEYYEDDLGPGQLVRQDSGYGTQFGSSGYYGGPAGYQTDWRQEQSLDRREPYPSEYPPPRQVSQQIMSNGMHTPSDWIEMTVTLLRQESGFGFRIVGGTEEGSQVSIGHIVPGGSADVDGRLQTGDEILHVDGINVVHSSHHHVVQLMGAASSRGRVTIGIRRRVGQPVAPRNDVITYPYDVTVTRRENEGFGFVIISSVTKAVSFIGQIIRGSPAERCERLHVGDRILAVNHVNIESLNHGDIVSLIKDSGYSVTLTVGPPIDDTSSNTTAASQQSSAGSMVMAQAIPTMPGEMPPPQPQMTYDQGYGMSEMGPPYSKRDMMPPGDQYLEDSVDGRTTDSDIGSYFTVELQRGPRGFGFSIRGGREFQNMPLFVLRIAENGPAAEDGRLQIGDQLVEINGISTTDMAHSEAIEVIKNGGPTVRLLVRRSSKIPSVLSEIDNMTQLSPINPSSTNHSGYSEARPGSSMSQPHLAPAYSTPNESNQSYGQPWIGSHTTNGPIHPHQSIGLASSTNQYVPLRPGAPPPILVHPSTRGHYPLQNGPLSHSSPRITTATDYYWERYPDVRQ
ncbi:membrane-associated guanylate kinase, WW and PDZ domain-containing protein 1-like isoform X2 [Artemia franciscana]|uniref:Uncharacterized protein n=2 Tax=Artemia franciscana TaxID=6661 RepID=A0AA88KSB5_ARTSF|nr:hypothetical protein QYM36_016696 [Artemia franciscana]